MRVQLVMLVYSIFVIRSMGNSGMLTLKVETHNLETIRQLRARHNDDNDDKVTMEERNGMGI